MLQNQDSGHVQRHEVDGAEGAPSDHQLAPVEDIEPDDTASRPKRPTWAVEGNIYGGARLLETPGKNVEAAREATLR